MPNDVLIVEDDPIIALDSEDTLLGFGVKTVRTAGIGGEGTCHDRRTAAGFCAARCRPDPRKEFCGRRTAGGAENPYAFVTGYGADALLPAAFTGRQRLAKPYSTDALKALLTRAADRGASAP